MFTQVKNYFILAVGFVVLVSGLKLPGCATSPQTTPAEKLRSIFPAATELLAIPSASPTTARAEMSVVKDVSEVIGYGVELEVVSRSGPFLILVALDPQFHVKQALVLSYPGSRGREVRSLAFTRQFQGKGPEDPIRVGQDIQAITGATISSRVMADGVRYAVQLARQRFG